MPNQTEPDRLQALESRVAELEAFAAAIVSCGVGGPELQRALREVDRGKVKAAKAEKAGK